MNKEILKKHTCGKTISDDRNRKVKFVWNIDSQKMLEYCLEVDRQNRREDPSIEGASSYIGMNLGKLREIYEDYNGLKELSTDALLSHGYYKLEVI